MQNGCNTNCMSSSALEGTVVDGRLFWEYYQCGYIKANKKVKTATTE